MYSNHSIVYGFFVLYLRSYFFLVIVPENKQGFKVHGIYNEITRKSAIASFNHLKTLLHKSNTCKPQANWNTSVTYSAADGGRPSTNAQFGEPSTAAISDAAISSGFGFEDVN